MPNSVVGSKLIDNGSHINGDSNREPLALLALNSEGTKEGSTINRKPNGFSLIEIVLSMFLILGIITIFLTASTTYSSSRRSNLQSVATKIASRQMENLRKTAFASLPSSGSFADSDLTQLPQGMATQTIASYQSSPDINQLTITVNWVDNGTAKSITLESLKYKNGL